MQTGDTGTLVRLSVQTELLPQESISADIRLFYVLQGEITLTTSDAYTVLGQEDIYLVNAGQQVKATAAPGGLLLAVCCVSDAWIRGMLGVSAVSFACDSTKGDASSFTALRGVLKEFLEDYVSSAAQQNPFTRACRCDRLGEILTQSFLQEETQLPDATTDRYDSRLRQIDRYIQTNYAQQIGLKELSQQLYLSVSYLSRFFKKHYHMSFADYLTQVRLSHAGEDLLRTQFPVTRIAYQNGFMNITAFNKAFKKKWGVTPTAYRKAHAAAGGGDGKKAEDVTVIRKEVSQLLAGQTAAQADRFSPGSSEKTIRLVVAPAGGDIGLCRIWDTVNIGGAQDLLNSGLRAQILLLKQELGIRYVRFWDLFSPLMLLELDGEEEQLNFSRLDMILDFLLDNDLRPHIELGTKPTRINKQMQEKWELTIGQVFHPDPAHWQSFLTELMQHVTVRYGQAVTDTWRMELWFDERERYEEDCVQDYFRRFSDTYRIIKSYSPGLEVGGFGYAAFDRQEDLFLISWLKQGPQPDFLGMTMFPYVFTYDGEDRLASRSTDPAFAAGSVRRAREILKEAGAAQVKLYITEWNLTASSRNYINDSCCRGAYFLKNILDIYGQVQSVAVYCGSDLLTEHYDSNTLLFGGSGLLTRDTILKPGAYAFKFLQKLAPRLAIRGDNFIVSTDGRNHYVIVCHHFCPPNASYYLTQENAVDPGRLQQYFDDAQDLVVQLQLSGFPAGHYRQKLYRVNTDSGSILDLWKGMNFTRDLSADDISYLRRACEPRFTMQTFECANGQAAFAIRLVPNEFCCLQLEQV